MSSPNLVILALNKKIIEEYSLNPTENNVLLILFIDGKTICSDFIDISLVNKIQFTIFAPPFLIGRGKLSYYLNVKLWIH